MKDLIKSIFADNGILKSFMPNFEIRNSQLEMALLVYESIKSRKHLLVEAGTGTGKSFAYLVPLIIYATTSNKPVIVSTKTKTLQEQMIKKDLPFLKKVFSKLKISFSYEVFYGSANYICNDRLVKFLSNPYFDFHYANSVFDDLLDFYESKQYNNSSGLRNDIKFEIPNLMWDMINREKDLCYKNRCKYFPAKCFYYKNFNKLSKTNIIIINHYLFFANIGSNYNLLPDFEIFVLDEAHNIEDIAVNFLATVISEYELNLLFTEIKSFTEIIIKESKSFEKLQKFQKIINNIQNEFKTFFTYIKKSFPHLYRVKSHTIIEDIIISQFKKFLDEFKFLFQSLNLTDEEVIVIEYHYKKMNSILNNLEEFIYHSKEDFVYWIELYKKNKYCSLKFTPINIADFLKEKLFQKNKIGIFTSATLSTNKNFNFIKKRIGIDSSIEKIFNSPFDFKSQVLMYINKKIEPPNNYEAYIIEIADKIEQLLIASSGRAFVLFTSYNTLQEVRKLLSKNLPFPLLTQGEALTWRLIKQFKNEISSVLFGTLSFWEGVDIPGESLSMVIITRLPFEMPEEPIISARLEFIKKNNGNPFFQYQLPHATILLKQGFGRLIRNKKDKGVVAILDSRLVTKIYGRYFLNSLPEIEITDSIEKVRIFLESKN